jgi:predicted tellurium resistance membrane protein TerC
VGNKLECLLGSQRTVAICAGLLGAYLRRGLMLFVVTLIIQNPWLKLVGTLKLFRLAFENLGREGQTGEKKNRAIKLGGTGGYGFTV